MTEAPGRCNFCGQQLKINALICRDAIVSSAFGEHVSSEETAGIEDL